MLAKNKLSILILGSGIVRPFLVPERACSSCGTGTVPICTNLSNTKALYITGHSYMHMVPDEPKAHLAEMQLIPQKFVVLTRSLYLKNGLRYDHVK